MWSDFYPLICGEDTHWGARDPQVQRQRPPRPFPWGPAPSPGAPPRPFPWGPAPRHYTSQAPLRGERSRSLPPGLARSRSGTAGAMAVWGERLAGVRGVLLDISGVLYDSGEGGGRPIAGSVEAVER